MAKSSKNRSKSFASFSRFVSYTALLTILGIGSWWFWQNNTEMKDLVYRYVENGDILTLESKYTPEQIMEVRRQELIGNDKRIYQEPSYKYYPYLLLDVKYYTTDKKSREGVMLWGMEDGEIVLNTETWETTHGFKDCLDGEANRNDFKIIQALAKRQGVLTIEELQKDLHVERDTLEPWLESARNKHLIVQKGHFVQLHFENPKILVFPQTQIKQHLVSKPIIHIQRAPKKYSRHQIIKMAQAAFGSEFKIRSEQEVFLPVYSLGVLNPDGSIHLSDWNAITAQRIIPQYLSKSSLSTDHYR